MLERAHAKLDGDLETLESRALEANG